MSRFRFILAGVVLASLVWAVCASAQPPRLRIKVAVPVLLKQVAKDSPTRTLRVGYTNIDRKEHVITLGWGALDSDLHPIYFEVKPGPKNQATSYLKTKNVYQSLVKARLKPGKTLVLDYTFDKKFATPPLLCFHTTVSQIDGARLSFYEGARTQSQYCPQF